MGRKKIGGFVIEWYIGDHLPLHVHIYKDGLHLGRFDLESQKPMKGLIMTDKLKRALVMGGFLKTVKK